MALYTRLLCSNVYRAGLFPGLQIKMDSLPYELLAEIFKIYVSLQDTFPETLLNVCRWWHTVASNESTLWTTFVISGARQTVRSGARSPTNDLGPWNYELTRDWVGIFERRLARAGPSLPLQISILDLNEAILPVIDVISGEAPDYVHLLRWETLDFATLELIRENDDQFWSSIANLISQPMPSLKRLTLEGNKIDFHAFPAAPNLEELNILFSRSPRIGRNNSFPMLKKVQITYPSKYPLSLVVLRKFSLHAIENLIVGGEVDVGSRMEGVYPSLLVLEFTERVPCGVASMSAPNLRHLILSCWNLFPLTYPPPEGEDQHADPLLKNRGVLERLARTFPTVEVLDVHRNVESLVRELIYGQTMFTRLKELWTVSKGRRKRVDLI